MLWDLEAARSIIGKGGYADNNAVEAAFNNPVVQLLNASESKMKKRVAGASAARYAGESETLKEFSGLYEQYTQKIRGDAKAMIATWDNVDDSLKDNFADLDAAQKHVGIDMKLGNFFADLDEAQAGLAGGIIGLFGGGSSYSGAGTYGVNPGDVNWHATGGVIAEPIIGFDRSGNAHGFADVAEAIVPLDRLAVNSGGSSGDVISPTININVSAIDARGVEELFRRNQGLVVDSVIDSIIKSRSQRNAMRSLL